MTVFMAFHNTMPDKNSGKMNKRTGKSSRKYDFNLCLAHTNV
jgi:hypothetical protein